jgi:DNA-binding MarR family transcriptional regulator/GNAT superfamily N-acetyltransferase
MSAADVTALRRFNRSFTRRMGVLDERFLGRDRPVGAARFLFEIGPDGAGISELRRSLGLDSGYVSRILRDLEADGLVELAPDPADRRRRMVTLTPAGSAEWRLLDELSDDLAESVLEPLTTSQRRRLINSLALAERLLAAGFVTFDIVDPLSREAVDCVGAYFRELDRRFPAGFDPDGAPQTDAPSLTPPAGRFLVAHHGTEPVACGGIQTLEPRIGEIKRMWVADGWRGYGLGPRLLAELEAHGRDMGLDRVRLDTNPTLVEALALYQKSGYLPIERYNDNPYAGHWFEKRLSTGQI